MVAGPDTARPDNSDAVCPKEMLFGPCGGVQPDGGCEVDGRACPFCMAPDVPMWLPAPLRIEEADSPADYWVDFRPDPTLEWEVDEAATALRKVGAGVLVGDHVDDVTPHQPADVAAAITPHGLPVIATVSCRGRSESDLRDQIADLRESRVYAVHCVTGDHPRARLGLEQDPVFPLDGTRLAAIAARSGRVSVAESPAAPPRSWRVDRLVSKQRAGASLAILNHAGAPTQLIDFARAARARGVAMQLVAPVPVVTDQRSAAALDRFPGLMLPPGLVERVLESSDPESAGVDAAIAIGSRLADSGMFAGLNLSGVAGDVGLVARSELMASVVRGIEAARRTSR